jgi:hypothetical protein
MEPIMWFWLIDLSKYSLMGAGIIGIITGLLLLVIGFVIISLLVRLIHKI